RKKYANGIVANSMHGTVQRAPVIAPASGRPDSICRQLVTLATHCCVRLVGHVSRSWPRHVALAVPDCGVASVRMPDDARVLRLRFVVLVLAACEVGGTSPPAVDAVAAGAEP